MKTKNESFEVAVPDLEGTGTAKLVPIIVQLEWDEELSQWLLSPDSIRLIEDTKARHMGLLAPHQLKELRERLGFSQRKMGALFQVGEKTWSRWESGKHRPSRSSNLPIRALYEGELSVGYLLKCAGKAPKTPPQEATKSPSFAQIVGAFVFDAGSIDVPYSTGSIPLHFCVQPPHSLVTEDFPQIQLAHGLTSPEKRPDHSNATTTMPYNPIDLGTTRKDLFCAKAA
jgi:DNA-binding transcriptional regulator YiaG